MVFIITRWGLLLGSLRFWYRMFYKTCVKLGQLYTCLYLFMFQEMMMMSNDKLEELWTPLQTGRRNVLCVWLLPNWRKFLITPETEARVALVLVRQVIVTVAFFFVDSGADESVMDSVLAKQQGQCLLTLWFSRYSWGPNQVLGSEGIFKQPPAVPWPRRGH